MRECFARLCVCAPSGCSAFRGRKRVSPGTEVTDNSEQPPCVFWEVNLSPLERQPALLTADSSLQIHTADFFFSNNVLYICFVCFGYTCLLLSSSAGIRFQFLSLFYIDWRSGTLQIGSPETSNFVDGTATEFLAHRQLFLPDPVPITQTNWVAPHFVICTYILLFLFF